MPVLERIQKVWQPFSHRTKQDFLSNTEQTVNSPGELPSLCPDQSQVAFMRESRGAGGGGRGEGVGAGGGNPALCRLRW